ncbi:MAG TPA: glycine cleavage system aminomethyltransferase GcvT [Thermodesulfobacteriota bacterium]|nr:glycine cleavage system aminomethyltransferase GcvT [Thermodesulfobacteriota bacterium]
MTSEPKKTPLNAWHRSHGAHMVEFAGWEMPLNYPPGIVEEHLTTRRFCGLFDISHMGRFRISGEGAVPFLQYALTNNALALDPGQAQYTIISDENGTAVDDAYLYRLDEEEYRLVVNAANTQKDWDWLQNQRKKFSRVEMENHTARIAMFSLQGPLSKALLETILQGSGSRLPDPGKNNERRVWIEGTPVDVGRTGYTGEPLGFEIFFPAERAVVIWEKILRQGSERGVIPIGLGARDTLRLEAGLPLYGHEYGKDQEGRDIPILALTPAKIAVSFSESKGDYLGRQSLWKQLQEIQAREYGWNDLIPSTPLVPRRIWPVAVLSEGVVRQGFPVFAGDRPVGYVTSGTMVPYWKFEGQGISSRVSREKGRRSIALVYLDADLKEEQEVKISARGKLLTGRLVRRHLGAEAPPYARPVLAEEILIKRPGPREPLHFSTEILVRKARENTLWRQRQTINLIPSEQTPSPLVKLLSISDPCSRYAEHRNYEFLGEADVFYYQGTDFIEWVEVKLQEEMARFLGCTMVETRIISGQMANAAVYSSFVDYLNRVYRKTNPRRFRKVMNHHLGRGGHLSSQPMGALRDFISVAPDLDRMAAVNFPVLEENPYQIDLKQTEELIHRHKPELLILGKSMVLYREPLAELRRMVARLKEKTWILYDMAHVLGLIGPHFQDPFREGADIVTGSTHKTFFGTQRGIIASNLDETSEYYDLWKAITRRTFPGSLSNHHLGTLLGLLLAAYEMNAFAGDYQKQIIANAKAFAKALKDQGLQVEGDPGVGFTETHQVILRVGYTLGPETARRLEENNVIVNYQALPDDEGFSASSGLRTGVQEMTRFGMKEKDFAELAGLMADAILKNRLVKDEISRLRSPFLQMQYCLPEEQARPMIQDLLGIMI